NATQATGTAARPRPKAQAVPSASAAPTGPARSESRPRAASAPSTIRATAVMSRPWPRSWRPAAARPRAAMPGGVALAAVEAGARRRLGAGARRRRAREREGARRRVVVVGMRRTLTEATQPTRASLPHQDHGSLTARWGTRLAFARYTSM